MLGPRRSRLRYVAVVTSPLSTWLPTLVAVPLIGFALYRRLKRTFGRQRVAPRTMALRMALLSTISAVLLVVWSPTSAGLAAALAGLALGICLAMVGLAHTRFEITAEGKFYVPNRWIGSVVTALFLGRLAGRLFTISERTAQVTAGASPFAGLQRSPLTLGFFFLLAGYYVSYYAGVLAKAAKLAMPPA